MFKFPFKDIEVGGEHYLRRFYLGTVFGVTFYLHKFTRGDSDRNVHNHPWRFGGSFVLKGEYLEERFVDFAPDSDKGWIVKYRNIKWFNIINGNSFHRVVKTKPGTITLFWHTDYVKNKKWGFLSRKQYHDETIIEFKNHEGATDFSTAWWLKADRASIFS